jgi:hypothetical protein
MRRALKALLRSYGLKSEWNALIDSKDPLAALKIGQALDPDETE